MFLPLCEQQAVGGSSAPPPGPVEVESGAAGGLRCDGMEDRSNQGNNPTNFERSLRKDISILGKYYPGDTTILNT